MKSPLPTRGSGRDRARRHSLARPFGSPPFLEDIDFTAVMAEPFATGKALYNGYCANCHGINPSEYDEGSMFLSVYLVLYAANPNTVGAFLPVNGQPSEEAVNFIIGNPADPRQGGDDQHGQRPIAERCRQGRRVPRYHAPRASESHRNRRIFAACLLRIRSERGHPGCRSHGCGRQLRPDKDSDHG